MINLIDKVNENIKVYIKLDVILLALRVVIGLIFIQAGYGKMMNFDQTVQFFSSINIPMPLFNAILVTGTEFIGGILLVLGFATRLISLPLAFIMLVAIVTTELPFQHFSDFIMLKQLDYMLVLLLFSAVGAGSYSLDKKFDI